MIGLETMPRTMDNIGFYSSLGNESRFSDAHGDGRWCVRSTDERTAEVGSARGTWGQMIWTRRCSECWSLTQVGSAGLRLLARDAC